MSNRFKPRKSWREKLENPPAGLPKVVEGPATWEKRFGGRRVLVPTPLLVDGVVRKVRKGKLITVGQIRRQLAKEFGAEATCPLTTGIFLRIIAEVAEEDRSATTSCRSEKQITPYWRVVKDDGSLNPKFPGGVRGQAARLGQEGHKVAGKEKIPKVENFEKALV